MIILFGAPGAGKTVQGKLLAAKYGWQWLSERGLMISLNDKDVALALNHGMPIDNQKSIMALKAVFNQINSGQYRSVVLDGFPTNTSQIYWMMEQNLLQYIDGAIVLRVPRGELWKRLLARGRIDDTRAVIERRQDLYTRAIYGMLHVLRENNIRVADVNGCNEPEDVLERVEEVLGEWEIIPKKQYNKIDSF